MIKIIVPGCESQTENRKFAGCRVSLFARAGADRARVCRVEEHGGKTWISNRYLDGGPGSSAINIARVPDLCERS